MRTFGLYATGQKGRLVLEGLQRLPSFVVTYLDGCTDESDYNAIISFCEGRGIKVFQRQDRYIPVDTVDLLFFVGWQYLIHAHMQKSVVLHDAYLPELKGFAPTPTALILGRDLGATAFQPTDSEVDTGPIYLRWRIPTKHPVRLSHANELIAESYLLMIGAILNGDLMPEWSEPDELETFSIWRDAEDMIINWEYSAVRIENTVYALGPPLPGAKTTYRGKEIIVTEVEPCNDMVFVERHAGKIWSIKDNCPKVICGQGMLLIKEAVDCDGTPVKFNRLRVRLGA